MGLLVQAQGALREAAKNGSRIAQVIMREPPRSPHWPALERKWRKAHPTCAACGGIDKVQVHHVAPFHLFPALELDETNLISLCMAKGREHHFIIGHARNWHGANPNVRDDAASALTAVRAAAKP
jgi:5-methylcytosine-specific restriction endonuclease McrA